MGVDINLKDQHGQTPLHIAIRLFDWKDIRRQLITIQRLYNCGANPKAADNDKKTPLQLAKEFPDKLLSQRLVKILTTKVIPYVETGNQQGRLKSISYLQVFLVASLSTGYVILTKVS
jgi:hypothetical protein